MTYQEAMDFLEYTEGLGSVLGLENMIHLLTGLGNPQNRLKFVHVAGTNGKGSTSAYIANILASANYSVGRYISPSVLCYEEKIQITAKCDNGSMEHNYISKEDITKGLTEIKKVCDDITSSGKNHPTLFEVETALAFLHFVRKECDIVILEVGLGGRLDATNVISTVLCSVIASISMDHMNFLGDTLEKIALEKAGIIKIGIPVVSYHQDKRVRTVLEEVSRENNSTYREIDCNSITIIHQDISGSYFNYEKLLNLHILMVGTNQISNSILAILAIEELIKQGYHVTEDDIRHGLSKTTWKARFEIVKTNPYFVVDGAHNEDAAKVLVDNIKSYFPNKKIIYILGVLGDKDYESILNITGKFASYIITITPNNKRGLLSSTLADVAKKYCENVIDASNITKAIKLAFEIANAEDVIISFGSLSYLSEVYKEL
jgi:dihydrofolate synthase/folylpolyglutamate synthase